MKSPRFPRQPSGCRSPLNHKLMTKRGITPNRWTAVGNRPRPSTRLCFVNYPGTPKSWRVIEQYEYLEHRGGKNTQGVCSRETQESARQVCKALRGSSTKAPGALPFGLPPRHNRSHPGGPASWPPQYIPCCVTGRRGVTHNIAVDAC